MMLSAELGLTAIAGRFAEDDLASDVLLLAREGLLEHRRHQNSLSTLE